MNRIGRIGALLFVATWMPLKAQAEVSPARSQDGAVHAGFVPLLDGSSLEGWSHQGNWRVVHGVIARTESGGHLICRRIKVPDNFELCFEWKISRGGNSGVFYRPGRSEYQILDNANHINGKNPRTSAAALYFCMQPSHDATKPVGEWNSARVLCKETQVQHWLNEEKVIDFDHTNPKYHYNIGMMKARGGDITSRGGYVTLQDHGAAVWYRNLLLRQVTDSEALDQTPVKPAEISSELLTAERLKIKQTIAYIKRRAAEKSALANENTPASDKQ